MIPSPTSHLTFWVVLMVVWVVASLWIGRDNRRFLEQICRTDYNPYSVARLVRFAWSRSAQMLIVLFVTIAGFIAFDLHYQKQLRQATEDLIIATVAQPVAPSKQLPNFPQAQPVWISPPQTAQLNPQQMASLAPAAAGVVPDALPAMNDAMRRAGLIEQLYEPENLSPELQSKLDKIKQYYEEVLITYFYLRHCDRARDEDYHIIQSAMLQELASLNAQSRIQNEILVAAKGSYNEVYKEVSCTGPNVDAMQQQFRDYSSALMRNFNPNTSQR